MNKRAKSDHTRISHSLYLCLMSASAMVLGVSPSAWAACVNTSGPNYACVGNINSTQTVNAVDATVVTDGSLFLDTPSGNGLNIFGGGSSSIYLDAGAVIQTQAGNRGLNYFGSSGNSSFDATINGTIHGGSAGFAANHYGTGTITLNHYGTISGLNNGIDITTDDDVYGVYLNINTDSVVSGGTGYGINVSHGGTGSGYIFADGNVTGGTAGIAVSTGNDSIFSIAANNQVSGNTGIVLGNSGSASGNINTGADSVITGNNGAGVELSQSGTGSLTLTSNGTVIGHGSGYGYGIGVRLSHYGAGEVTLLINGDVTGDAYGIFSDSSSANGELKIGIGADSVVTGNNNQGIYVSRSGVGGVATSVDGSVVSNGSSPAMYLSHSGSGGITNYINGSVTANGNGNGISVFRSGTGTADTTIDGTVNATGSGYGYYGRHLGSNTHTVNVNGTLSSANSAAIYMDIESSSTGNVAIATGSQSVLSGGSNGIYLYSGGMGDIDLDIGGAVTGQYSGIQFGNYGTGKSNIGINGAVTGNEGLFLQSANGSGEMRIALTGDAVITGLTGIGANIEYSGNDTLFALITGRVTGQTNALYIANYSLQNASINTLGILEGKNGTAIRIVSASSAPTDLNVYGGRIIGDVVDDNAALGKSLVHIKGDFTAEGNFTVSDFDVDSDGDFRIGSSNVIDSANTIDVYGTLETTGINGAVISNDINIHNGGLVHVADSHSLNIGTNTTVNGTLSIGAGAMYLTDTMSAGSGTLSFDVLSKTDHGYLEVMNGAVNLTGTSVVMNVRDVGGLSDDDTFMIMHGNGTVVGGPGSTLTAISSTSVLWGFSMVDGTQAGTTDADIFVVAKQKAAVSQLTNTSNNQNAADALMSLQSTATDPQLLAVLSNFNGASSEAEFNKVLESVQAAIDAGDSHVAMNQMRRVQGITNMRLENLRFSGGDTNLNKMGFTSQNSDISTQGAVWATSYGDHPLVSGQSNSVLDGARAWGGLAGQYGRQRTSEGIAGYKSRSNGVVFGADSNTLFSDMTIGAALGISNMRVRSDNANDALNKTDAYQMTLYGEHRLPHNSYINAAVSYAVGRNETHRYNVGGVAGLTASGDFDAQQWGVSTSVGHHMVIGKYMLTPSVHADWVRYNADSYTEKGAGGAGLSINSKSMDSVETGLRMKVRREFITAEKNSIIPEIRAGYRYDFVGDRMRKDLQFIGGGAGFAVESPDPARHKFNVGTGIVYKTQDNMDFAVHYDLDVEKKYTAHSVGVRATYKF